MLQMVNATPTLESHTQLMNSVYSDFSVLQEIFLPNTTTAVDPKLVLQTRGAYLPPGPESPQEPKHSPPSTPCVPLSVKELEKEEEEDVSRLASSPPSAIRSTKSPQVDIVNLALEEIRKPPPGKVKEDAAKGRVPWNLAAAGLLPPDPGALAHPYPGYPAHPPVGSHPATSAYPSPHLLPQGLSSELPYSSYSNIAAAAAMGVSAHPTSVPMSHSAPSIGTHSAPSSDTLVTPSATATVSTNPPGYKMEPTDPSMYYPGAVSTTPGEGDHQQGAHPSLGLFNPHQPHSGLGDPGLGQSDVIQQTLQQYFNVDMQQSHEGSENGAGLSWEHGQLHPGLFSHHEYDYGRGYTDRKKKIIREWNKTNSSPRPAETLTSDPLRPSYMPGHEFLGTPYSPYAAVKDEPLRTEYSPYAAYGYPDLVNPYAHHAMSRREKRKKQDSLPGGNSLTRDERKAQALGLPIPCSEIINLPMDEFNDLLSKHELTEEQLTLCRDIRRRGKNKVAAQNCRKRKIDQIKQLETEVTRIKCRKTELVTDHEKLMAQRSTWADLVKRLHDYVLKELGHDPLHWQLQMDHNRQVHILPRENPQSHEQAVNMAAAAKGNRGGYDMGQRPSHVGHLPQQPLGHPIQQQIHQNPS